MVFNGAFGRRPNGLVSETLPAALVGRGDAVAGTPLLANHSPPVLLAHFVCDACYAADALSRQAVSLSSWSQSGHRKMRISVSPPGTGEMAIKCISVAQRQSGSSVEPASSSRSNFDMTPPHLGPTVRIARQHFDLPAVVSGTL
jgi:hypothetical protein